MKKLVLLLVLIVLPLTTMGCGSQEQTVAATVAPSPTALPTEEPTEKPTEEPTPLPSATPTEEPTPRPTIWAPVAPAGPCEPSETKSCTVLFVLPGPRYSPWAVPLVREFEQFGYSTLVASNAREVVRPCSAGGFDVPVDVAMVDVNVDDYDALIFVGGDGCRSQWNDSESHRIIQEAVAHEKVLAAAGCASTILAHAGVLEGKEVAVCQTAAGVKGGLDYNEVLADLGAIPGVDIVVRNDLIVTSEAKSRFIVSGILETLGSLEQ